MKMEFYKIYIVLCTMLLIEIHGFYLKQDEHQIIDKSETENFRNILNSWNNFKRKLTEHSKLIGFNGNIENSNFNELEVLQMIPSIIDQYRAKTLTTDDQFILSEIYGTLWPIICQEAERQNDEEINPLLKALLDSFQLTKQITNDIEGNSVIQMHQHKKPKNILTHKLLMNVNRNDHPSQRVLNTAAILIRQMNTRNSSEMQTKNDQSKIPKKNHLKRSKHQQHQHQQQQRNSVPRRATLNLQLTNIPLNEISRSKRQIEYRLNSADIPAAKIDALLKIFREDNDIESNEDDNNDDDYNEDDNDVDDQTNHIKNNFLPMTNKDYSYDDLYEDDEEAASNKNQDPDYGSFQDLILLAAKHRLRREEEETQILNT